MFNLKLLDVVIGVVFFFVFASLICSAVRELIESVISARATMLEKALRELLDDDEPKKDGATSVLVQFFEHPLIDSLFPGDYTPSFVSQIPFVGGLWAAMQSYGNHRKLPSYIPKENFAAAVFDIFAEHACPREIGDRPPQRQRFEEIRKWTAKLVAAQGDGGEDAATPPGEQTKTTYAAPPSKRLAKAVLWALDNSNSDLKAAHEQLEAWYDSSMDRVSGWYKRQTQFILFAVGLVLAFSLNLNAVNVVERLYYDEEFRRAIVADATEATKKPGLQEEIQQERPKNNAWLDIDASAAPGEQTRKPDAVTAVINLQNDLNSYGYPVGWTSNTWNIFARSWQNKDKLVMITSVLGWLITAAAMTAGAPFWFDLLNKLVSLRSSLKPDTPPQKQDGSR